MKTPFTFIIFSLMFSLLGQAQSKHTFFLNNGVTYSNHLKLHGEKVKNSRAYLVNFGLNYRILKLKFFSMETGIGGRAVFSSGTVKQEKFDANTLRLTIPLKFVVPVSNKWTTASGFIFQNNVDASEFDIRLRDKYSWRVDFIAEVRYTINNFWYLTAGYSVNLRDMPDAYFINDPKAGFQIGIARHTYIFKKEKL